MQTRVSLTDPILTYVSLTDAMHRYPWPISDTVLCTLFKYRFLILYALINEKHVKTTRIRELGSWAVTFALI
jgi:hypothetical protein